MISTMEQNKKQQGILVSFLGIIFIGCLIQAAGWIKGDSLVFPSVPDILKATIRLLQDNQTYSRILVTFKNLAVSLLISSIIGISIGVGEGKSLFFRAFLRPLETFLRSIPMIVMVVVIMVITKYEYVPVIATSLFLIPLISEATCEGYLSLDKDLLDVYRMEGDFSFRILRRVYIPLMSGYLKQAYISAVGMGMKIVVSSEYLVQTNNSLGKAIYSSSYFNEYQDIYAYALIMILLVLIVSSLPLLLLRHNR